MFHLLCYFFIHRQHDIVCQFIIITELTMRSISQKTDAIHKAIRLEQIQQKFSHSRMLLRQVDSSQAIGIILNCQAQLHSALEAKDQRATVFNLTQLHNVVSQYAIIDFLLNDVKFSLDLESVQNGSLPVECTWVDLFLVLLGEENELIREESSALVYLSAYQIRLVIQSKKEKMQYQSQIQRVLEDLPLKLLKDVNIKVALNLMDTLQQLFQTQISEQTIPYLIGIRPDFLSVLIDLYKTGYDGSDYLDNVVNISLMLLAYSLQSDYFIDLPELKILQNLTKDYLVSKIYNCDFSQQVYKKIKVLSLSNISLQQKQADHLLQNTLINEMQKKNVDYLQMLVAITLTNPHFFPQNALRVVFTQLFSQIENNNEEELNYRRWLAILAMKNYTKVSEMLQCGIENVLVDWNQPGFTQSLKFLVESAHGKYKPFFNLFLDICFIIYESLPNCWTVLDQRLHFLSSYTEWYELMERATFAQEIISK